jgi:hypothetical protein
MLTILIIIAALAGLLGLGALAALLWLGRSLSWSTIEDDEPAAGTPRHRGLPLWLTAWLRPRRDLLTYRRDERGRFRRYRR